MKFFRHAPQIPPAISTQDKGKSVIVIREGLVATSLLMFGHLNDFRIRPNRNSANERVYEVHLQIANAWQELATDDDVFVFDPASLTRVERIDIMDAMSGIITGFRGPEQEEVDGAVISILDTYRSN